LLHSSLDDRVADLVSSYTSPQHADHNDVPVEECWLNYQLL